MRRLVKVLLLALLVILPTAGVGAQTSGPVYIVQLGDSLSTIAVMFGTTVDALVETNGIADPSLVYPGMELVIPGFEGISGVLTSRPVGYGETLASLSLRYGVPREALVRLNRIVSPGRVYAGQALVIPEAADSPMKLEQANLLLPVAGQGALELAARAGVNPWRLGATNGLGTRLWVLPGVILAAPGGNEPVWSLPAPVTGVELLPQQSAQGRTTEVRLDLSSSAWAEGSLGEWPLHFYPFNGVNLAALQGIHAMAQPGLYDLELRIFSSQGGELIYAFSQPIVVAEAGYPNDPPLRVPAETLDPAVTAPEDELVASLVAASTPDRLWEGTFLFPSTSTDAFPSRFGSRRNYNDSGYIYYHAGLDLYGRSGTPITASARGRVVFAGPMTVRGNTTFIDHGWGVYTGYLHQSEILVSVGDMVEAGQTIGLVGATGRVTGPHLHWEIWVGGVPVDPLEWTSQVFP